MPLRSIAFLAYFFGSCAGTLAIPMLGVICYVVLYHIYPQTTWWGKSIEFLGLRYSFICGLCLLIGTVVNCGRLRFGRRFLHPLEWALVLMFFCMILSSVTGMPWDERTEYVLDKMAKVLLFVFLLSHVAVTRKQLWQLTIVLVALTLYLGHEAKIAPPGAFANNRLNGIGGPDFRESAGLAVHLFALMPFVAVLLRCRSFWLKLLAFFAACYGLNAIVLCRARSAFLAGMITAVFAIFYIPRGHRRWAICVLVLAIAGGFSLSDTYFWDRMETIWSPAEQRDYSAASRFDIWAAAWRMFTDNPLGIGIGQFERQIVNYCAGDKLLAGRDAHNSYVLCLAEMGLPGIVTYLATLGLSWATMSQLNRKVRRKLADPLFFQLLIFANRLALLVYMISGLFISRLYTEGIWWFIAMPVCIRRAVENELREESLAVAPAGTAAVPALALSRQVAT